jgi:hypothetical protein
MKEFNTKKLELLISGKPKCSLPFRGLAKLFIGRRSRSEHAANVRFKHIRLDCPRITTRCSLIDYWTNCR